MEPIGIFLEKYRRGEAGATLVKKTLLKIISGVVGVEIDVAAATLRGGAVYLNVSPVAHSEIFIKKAAIITAFNQQFPKSKILSIR
ncbi:MAG: hypothetical protein A3D52_03195 [Candidatus Taylorbacteria bacterium RIFCSPHIGHO2_02_FULL_44_36]|uniref:Uncharacterized protein n=1 Tax=Candidatus Taylorbacteria bacterium RIFCSPLOWO2_12_FULL_44_15c TaxID=1802333 RepID=A0A1G2P6T5_9BACT|nr:MAG: hypothetical protein A3D52_03195 [Candidatus Taylorbacteria bacterium RIFCSPHIGHO2_02_FULL_44_36]OHA38349.1 MAG: hypothetical protein A3I97_02425 [Candidatus Taylorbacteria bacterium RIFCSPLOWO2_02_FULL_44_35]OHA44020.1 MAG: hypothetical protein A3G03_00475 [Candidatus Taylorbacteria bacterium RIFCSPLOWO2_12_FULL_44_15c]